ncbi:MAG: DUF2341 domain-containing protein, partial [Promethearchaeota archaeon]
PDGDDIAFATDGDWLDHEIISFDQAYSSTEAQLKVWVQIPYLYATKNTTIAMYYGNSTMSSRENSEGVWDSGYEGVYHLDDDFLDSTSNSRDGTNTGSVDISGIIGDGQDFERDRGTDNINIGTWSVSGTQITIQAWINLESFDIGDARILSKNSGSSNSEQSHVWMLGTNTVPYRLRGRIKTGTSDGSGTSTNVATSGDLSTGTWYLTSLIYDGSNMRYVLDGNPVGSFSKTGTLRINSWPIVIGNSPAGSRNIDGIIDEVRISSTVRSNDWLKTEYDNQMDPTSFGSIGQEQVVNDITPNADHFDYHKIITIDHNQVNGTGSHVNFPLLVSLHDTDLRFDVQSDGDDIAFSMEGQWLDHQIELFDQSYNGTHAQLVAWVRIPFLSTVEDTEITMHYGNSTMNSRQNPTGVWMTDYKAVWHFNEPTGTGDYIKDSTINNYDATPFGTQFLSSGQIDGARSFSATGDNRIIVNQGSEFFNGDNSFTFSFWIYPNYASDLEWETLTEGQVFFKSSSIGLSRLWRQSFFGPGEGRFQPDIRFETYGSTYLNVLLYRQQWTYVTYSYDGNYLRAYRNDQLASSENIGGFPLLADTSSFYFGRNFNSLKGHLDEFRVLDTYRSDGWISTEYYNQVNHSTFFDISEEKHSKPIIEVDVLINTIDLYDNLLPNVTISMFQYTDLIETGVTDIDGTVSFTDLIAGEYNFTASIYSDLAGITEIVNITSQAMLLNQTFQSIDIICNVSSHFFELVDIDGSPLESGWIMVGNDTHILKQCNIDPTGHTMFWWEDAPASEYNYTVYYSNGLYNPSTITLDSGDITTKNDTIYIQVELTTIDFLVQTITQPITPVSGAKLILTLDNPLGASIANLTTDINGKATLRWLNSSGIGGDYCVQIEFFGVTRLFNDTIGPATVYNYSFTVNNKDSLEFRMSIDLNIFQTELISLNPTDYIEIEWGSTIKLRTLFNVSKVEMGYESLLGPSDADSMTYEMLLGGHVVQSGIFFEEDGIIGRYSTNIDTTHVDSDEKYIIIISAYKSGFTIPSDLILQLNILENDLELNQSNNDDTALTSYWLENVDMTLKSYGVNSETLTIENALYQSVDHDFSFLISDVYNNWNLSKIIFNIYGISWNTNISNINITIEDP